MNNSRIDSNSISLKLINDSTSSIEVQILINTSLETLADFTLTALISLIDSIFALQSSLSKGKDPGSSYSKRITYFRSFILAL